MQIKNGKGIAKIINPYPNDTTISKTANVNSTKRIGTFMCFMPAGPEPENYIPWDWGYLFNNPNVSGVSADIAKYMEYLVVEDVGVGGGGSGGSTGFIADEIVPGASNNDPANAWWDDNKSDPNTNYTPQAKPKWNDVYTNYPKDANGGDMLINDVCKLIGGEIFSMYNKGNISNACALRVSRALNYSGINIPAISGQTKQGADGKNYFLLASQLKNWLVKTLGQPDIHKTAAEGAPNGTNFYNLLIGINNRGIYIMKPISESNFGASGHATLWAGLDCIGQHNYFGAASDIYIWTLPQ